MRRTATTKKRRRKTEEQAQTMRAKETIQKTRNNSCKLAALSFSFFDVFDSTKNTCQHNKFRSKIEERHFCSNYRVFQKHFAFQCPDCKIIACVSC